MRSRRSLVVAALGTALVATPLAAGAATGYEVAAVTDGGVLTGTVRFAGALPRLESIPVTRNSEVCGDRVPSEALVLGPDRGVAGSVVLIEGIERGKKGSAEVILDTAGCLFVAHVTAVGPGARVRVKNSDAILHNTHGFRGRTTVFNVALPHKHQMIDITRRLGTPGVVRVVCDAHPHMFAWLVVHDSPYVAVTDARGAFRMADVPPGTYRVTMWHAGFRPKGVGKDGRPAHRGPTMVTREIAMAPKATVTVDFELR